MLLAGDLSSPTKATTENLLQSLSSNSSIFSGKHLVCNFEGLISDINNNNINTPEPILFNHPSVPGALSKVVKPIFCMANNHVLDLPHQFKHTIEILNNQKIEYCGAGYTEEEANKPVLLKEGVWDVFIFNACWEFLLYNHKNPLKGVYVSVLTEERFLKEVEFIKRINPSAKIVVYLHWNLDLETLPFPMYRKFAMDLADAGADLIVGSHSHCVQGGEKYKNSYIIYGLGNFFIPHKIFAKGNVYYPEFSATELVIEWLPDSHNLECHWFRYDLKNEKHLLLYLGSDSFENSDRLALFSPYSGIGHEDYLSYYIKNRRKRIFIPVYKDYKDTRRNKFYTSFLKKRAKFARLLAKMKLTEWNK